MGMGKELSLSERDSCQGSKIGNNLAELYDCGIFFFFFFLQFSKGQQREISQIMKMIGEPLSGVMRAEMWGGVNRFEMFFFERKARVFRGFWD